MKQKYKYLSKLLDGQKWVAIDIETTHLDETVGEIIQLYAIGFDGHEFNARFKPNRLDKAHPMALKINNYWNEEKLYDNGLDFELYIEGITKYLKRYKMVVGKNVHFDMKWLEYHLDCDSLPYRHFDLSTLAVTRLSNHISYFNMPSLCEFVLDKKASHNAKQDVEDTLKIMDILLDNDMLVRLYLKYRYWRLRWTTKPYYLK